MTKVNINGRDHQVELHTEPGDETPLADVVNAARRLWHDTLQPEPGPGPASAGSATERSHQTIGYAWHLGAGDQLPVKTHHLEAGSRE